MKTPKVEFRRIKKGSVRDDQAVALTEKGLTVLPRGALDDSDVEVLFDVIEDGLNRTEARLRRLENSRQLDTTDPEFGCELTARQMVERIDADARRIARDAVNALESLSDDLRSLSADDMFARIWEAQNEVNPYTAGAYCMYESPSGKWCGFFDQHGEKVGGRWYCRLHWQMAPNQEEVEVTQPEHEPNRVIATPTLRKPTAKLIVELDAEAMQEDICKDVVFNETDRLAIELYDNKVPFGDIYLSVTHYDPATGKPTVVFRTRREDLDGEGCAW